MLLKKRRTKALALKKKKTAKKKLFVYLRQSAMVVADPD